MLAQPLQINISVNTSDFWYINSFPFYQKGFEPENEFLLIPKSVSEFHFKTSKEKVNK